MFAEICIFTTFTLDNLFPGPHGARFTMFNSDTTSQVLFASMLLLVPVIFFCRFVASLFLVLWLGRLQQRKPLPGLRWILILCYIFIPLVQVVWPFLGPSLTSLLSTAAFRWMNLPVGKYIEYLIISCLLGPATLLAAGGCLFMVWLWLATRTKQPAQFARQDAR
jgi:hypothetical protein